MTWLTLGMGMLDLNVSNQYIHRSSSPQDTTVHNDAFLCGDICVSVDQECHVRTVHNLHRRLFFQCICDDSYKLGARDIIAVRRVYVQAIFLHKNNFWLELSEGKFFFCNIVGNVKLDYHLGLVWWFVCCCLPLKGSREKGHLGSAFIAACNVFYWCIVLFQRFNSKCIRTSHKCTIAAHGLPTLFTVNAVHYIIGFTVS